MAPFFSAFLPVDLIAVFERAADGISTLIDVTYAREDDDFEDSVCLP